MSTGTHNYRSRTGRPPVGPRIEVRVRPWIAALIDRYACEHDVTRAAAIRWLLALGLMHAHADMHTTTTRSPR